MLWPTSKKKKSTVFEEQTDGAANDVRPEFDPKKMSPGSEHGRRWYNMNGLIVKLDTTGVRDSQKEALTAIVLALEENVNKQKKKHEVPAENVIASLLPAASLWLQDRGTAAKLLRSCHEGDYRGSGAHGLLWKLGEQDGGGKWSRGGFSVERWKFWRQRLEELPKHRCADERTAEICRKVLETMAEVEVS